MNRYNFSKAEVKRALSGENVPNFMKRFAFKKKDGKLFFEGREVIPNEEREKYLRKVLYDTDSEMPFGRDSLYYLLKKKTINISKRFIESFLKAQNVIVKRTAKPRKENRKFVSTVKKAGAVSADLVHIEPKDLPDGYMPDPEEEDDEEYKPGQDNKPKWGKVKKTYYMYNVVDKLTAYLVSEVVHSKNEKIIAKATTRLLRKMAKALSTPVRVFEIDQGTEFNLSEKQLAKLKRPNSVTVKRMRTNALVEGVNAKLQRIFYTIAKQRRGGFRASMEQAVKISNNTLNRTLGMTPNEAVKLLKSGEPLKRRDGKHPKPIMKKNAYKVGMKVRALKTARAKEKPGYKAYKGKHYGPVKTITRVIFYQGYPRYELDNKKRTKKNVGNKSQGVSLLKWHDQLTLAQDVDQTSLVSSRPIVMWEASRAGTPAQKYKKGSKITYTTNGEQYKALVKEKRGSQWRIKYLKNGKAYQTTVSENEIKPR